VSQQQCELATNANFFGQAKYSQLSKHQGIGNFSTMGLLMDKNLDPMDL
jgi:hypothetical protein